LKEKTTNRLSKRSKMVEVEKHLAAGNIKFRTAFRESVYFRMRDQDRTGLFSNLPKIFYTAFAIGYHFNKKTPIASKSINHINLVSLDRSVTELMVRLVLKKSPKLEDSKDLWREVEQYAEYGIQVLFDVWKEKGIMDVDVILEK